MDEFEAFRVMRGDKTVQEDVDMLYEHFRDVVMKRNQWSFVELAMFLESRLKTKRHVLNRHDRTVFSLLLTRIRNNYEQIDKLLKESKHEDL